ncbi:MAG: DUF2461 domain-containing protein [Bacteroidales bacterium]|jgi:uncharacterized protein (TIGR02453 family)|nr:DUF2461 domain-containing protein [Bacteroidales bacterium]
MPQIKKSTLLFLSDLKNNNDRNWFAENRKRYEDAKSNYETFVQEILNEIVRFDPIFRGLEPKSCMFRINRDTRFSHDKSVYKTNFGAFMVRGGKKNGDKFPGYYFHIEPGSSFVAGGAYIPPAPWLNAIRERIDGDAERLIKIVNDKEFRRYFGGLEGEKLRTAPKGYPRDHPHIELLKMKSYLAEMTIPDEVITSDECFDLVIGSFRAMKPLNDFLTVGDY